MYLKKSYLVAAVLAVAFLFASNIRADVINFIDWDPTDRNAVGVNFNPIGTLTFWWDTAPMSGPTWVNGIPLSLPVDPFRLDWNLTNDNPWNVMLGWTPLTNDNWTHLSISGAGTITDLTFNNMAVGLAGYSGDNWSWDGSTLWLVNGWSGVDYLSHLSFYATNFPAGFTITAYNGAVVPEPATLAVIGLGLVGLGYARRRSRNAKAAA